MAQPWYERCNGWLHDENNVKGFFSEFRFLSNFHDCPVEFEGLLYPSSEAAYQSAKTLDLADRERFTKMKPSKALREGRLLQMNNKVRDDWRDIKIRTMGWVLKDKFTRNQDLRELLLTTGEKYLEETNWWRDVVWGVHNGVGENYLGKILMAIRKDIKTGRLK